MSDDLTPEDLELRRTLTFRLRSERRLSWKAISRALAAGTVNPATGEKVWFTISPTVVRSDYYLVLRRDGYVPDAAQVEEARAAELLKLDQLEDTYWERATGYTETVDGTVRDHPPDEVAANLVLRVMRQRAQLTGMNQVRLSGPDGGPIPVELSVPDDMIARILTDSLDRARAEATADEPSMN